VALKKRVETEIREGRNHQAFDSARALYEIAPNDANRNLVVEATLDEAQRRLELHQAVQAVTIASRVCMLVETDGEKERLAEILARSGNLSRAWLLAQQLANPGLIARIFCHAADCAVCGKPTVTEGVPTDFISQKELMIRAFGEVADGQDEQARATLQAIGLTSPFLEWKVLLRGFLAYYQSDNAKAVENWQRLNPKRVPARLAAPFLMRIGPGFRTAQTSQAQERLQATFDHLQGGDLIRRLRTLQRYLANERHLSQAFRHAEQLMPRLRTEAPGLIPRIAACFFWIIVDHGFPEDKHRYKRVFGGSLEDPELHRMEALALESRHQLDDAHEAWQRYERSLAIHDAALPSGHADLMRSLVWRHMADNANSLPDERMLRMLDRLPFSQFGEVPRPLKPDAETCLRHSLKLAPDRLEAHISLFKHYLAADKPKKTLQAGKRLLKKFPNHGPTLDRMGDLFLQAGDTAEALTHYKRAVEASPLDSQLRSKLALAHAASAEASTKLRSFDDARQGFQAALALGDQSHRLAVLCQWAASEFLAGNAGQAEELLTQARSEPSHRLAIAYSMLSHVARLKLGKILKTRFGNDFKELLAQPFDAVAGTALATEAATHRLSGSAYVGQKTHERKVMGYLDKAEGAALSEAQLRQVCDALADLNVPKRMQSFFVQGQARFPNNPHFFLAEVDHELSRSRYLISPFRVSNLLKKVRELAASLPRADREAFLEQVEEREKELRTLSPFDDLLDLAGFRASAEAFADGFEESDVEDDEKDWE
jgi:tetratricopeptide (TPR) repeat protein